MHLSYWNKCHQSMVEINLIYRYICFIFWFGTVKPPSLIQETVKQSLWTVWSQNIDRIFKKTGSSLLEIVFQKHQSHIATTSDSWAAAILVQCIFIKFISRHWHYYNLISWHIDDAGTRSMELWYFPINSLSVSAKRFEIADTKYFTPSRSVENCRFWSTLKMVDFKLFFQMPSTLCTQVGYEGVELELWNFIHV